MQQSFRRQQTAHYRSEKKSLNSKYATSLSHRLLFPRGASTVKWKWPASACIGAHECEHLVTCEPKLHFKFLADQPRGSSRVAKSRRRGMASCRRVAPRESTDAPVCKSALPSWSLIATRCCATLWLEIDRGEFAFTSHALRASFILFSRLPRRRWISAQDRLQDHLLSSDVFLGVDEFWGRYSGIQGMYLSVPFRVHR